MKPRTATRTIQNILIIFLTIAMFLPIYILLVNTFKDGSKIMAEPLALPNPPTLDNIRNIISDSHVNVLEMYLNSIFLTIVGTFANVFIS